jgi:hypothetical protein
MGVEIPIFDVLETDGNFLVKFKRVTRKISSIESFYFKIKDDDLVLGYASKNKHEFSYILKGIPFGLLYKIKDKNVIKVEESHKNVGFDFIAINAFTLAASGVS